MSVEAFITPPTPSIALGDGLGAGPLLRPFEEEVLDKVGDPADSVRLISGADPKHQDQAGRHPIRHRGRQEAGPTLEVDAYVVIS